MAALTRYTDPLLVQSDHSPAGQNWHDNHSVWHGLEFVTLNTGGLIGTQWYRDSGPLGMAPEKLEPRAFCTRGGLTFQFTGRILIVRLNVAWSWYLFAQLRIDGQLPSTMGLLTARDVLSCDAATYGLLQDDYIDVLCADGLLNGLHTATITIDNPDASKFFAISGFKTGFVPPVALRGHDEWLVPAASNIVPNHIALKITNRQAAPVHNIKLSFPPGWMTTAGGPLAPLELTTMQPGDVATYTAAPVYTGDEHSGEQGYVLELLANYPDPHGSIVIGTDFTIAANSPAITMTPSPWFTDTATPDSSPRRYCDHRSTLGEPWVLQFDFAGDTLDITVQRSAGWGVMGLYDGPDDGATLIGTLDCSVDEGGAFHTYHFSGWGLGDHVCYLRKTVEDGLFVIFVRGAWSTAATYSLVVERFALEFLGRQPIAMPVENIATPDGYVFTFDAPGQSLHDYANVPVRDNAGAFETEALIRFMTFAVFYGPGRFDLLAEYDVLIVDPIGAKTADVIAWQARGIKVFGYISSGEEVGFYRDRYDFTSPLAPRMDGTGPGGYSSNYMFTRHPFAGPPDGNLVWASYYLDPRPGSGWKERIVDYYAPQVFDGPGIVTDEVVTILAVTIAAGPRFVFDTAISPLDPDEPIILKTFDGSHTYTRFADFTYDAKTGAFVMAPTVLPPVVEGQQLKISYTRKGHHCDGIFWDTVDTPDVYSSDQFGYVYVPGYAEAFANLMNEIAHLYPTKRIIYNRGFTILPDIIGTAHGVMFETWLSAPTNIWDLTNTGYYRIDDPAVIAYNEDANRLMRELRVHRVFDVYSLNYAVPGPDGDELREYCRAEDARRGYSSWQTIITLNNPDHNNAVDSGDPRVQSSAFRVMQRYPYDPTDWDGGASIWDGGSTEWIS